MPEKILLIEDHPDVRENLAEILALAKYEVATAANGKEGVKKAYEFSPDLIICDIMMPELDGYGVLHLLGKEPETRDIPFIFLTAKSEQEDFRKGMGLGADDYLTKPFDDTELLNTVEMRLKKAKSRRAPLETGKKGFDNFINEARGFEELKKLAESYQSRPYQKKEIIFEAESYPKGVFYLESGKVKIFLTNADGKEFISELIHPGQFFGYSALLEGNPYTESAEVLENAEIVFIPRDDFFSLIFSNREVLAYNSVRKRVAEALIMIYQRYANPEDKKPYSISLSRENFAALVGTATETVIRTLSDFKEEGLISIRGSNVTILDPERLVQLKN
jgi:CRP/FNR family transcriptional regulator, polysaccharide utilization system transcription regulator